MKVSGDAANLLYRGVASQEILWYKKMGTGVVIAKWIAHLERDKMLFDFPHVPAAAHISERAIEHAPKLDARQCLWVVSPFFHIL